MPRKLEIINPIEYKDWDNIVVSSPGYSVFHSSAWARVLSNSYQYNPLYFTAIENGRFKILVPVMEVNSFLTGKRGVSLPFTDYCEPVFNNGVSFRDVLEEIIKYGKKSGWKYLELRGGESLMPQAVPSTTYLGHMLDLSENEELILSCFRDSTRRNIKKAIVGGVRAKISNSIESLTEFYDLNSLTRRRHGLPPQPFHFFKKVYDHIISRNLGLLVIASYENNPIAGAVYFHFGKKALYKYGASDMNYQHLRANNLVMWEAIKWYCKNRYKTLCFGRTEEENQGLRVFKTGWNTKENKIKYYKYDLDKSSFIVDKSKVTPFHNRIFSKMPVTLLNVVGSALYKHMG